MNESFAHLVDPIVRYVIDTQRRIALASAGQPSLDEVHDDLMRSIQEVAIIGRVVRPTCATTSIWPSMPSSTGPTRC